MKVKMFQRCLFYWFEGSLCQLVQDQGQVPGRDSHMTFGSVSVEAIQETREIFIFTDIYARISQFISNG